MQKNETVTDWRRAVLVIGALALVHLAASLGLLFLLRGAIIPVTRLTAMIGYALLWPSTYLVGKALLAAGLPQLTGHWSGVLIAIPVNSILWAIILYGIWLLATSTRRWWRAR